MCKKSQVKYVKSEKTKRFLWVEGGCQHSQQLHPGPPLRLESGSHTLPYGNSQEHPPLEWLAMGHPFLQHWLSATPGERPCLHLLSSTMEDARGAQDQA